MTVIEYMIQAYGPNGQWQVGPSFHTLARAEKDYAEVKVWNPRVKYRLVKVTTTTETTEEVVLGG